jgi:hypothetical protein
MHIDCHLQCLWDLYSAFLPVLLSIKKSFSDELFWSLNFMNGILPNVDDEMHQYAAVKRELLMHQISMHRTSDAFHLLTAVKRELLHALWLGSSSLSFFIRLTGHITMSKLTDIVNTG